MFGVGINLSSALCSRSPNVLKPAMRANRLANPATSKPLPGLTLIKASASVPSTDKLEKTLPIVTREKPAMTIA